LFGGLRFKAPVKLREALTIELRDFEDSRLASHERRNGHACFRFVFGFNEGPADVNAAGAGPVEMPEIALRVEKLNEINADVLLVRGFDQKAVHAPSSLAVRE